MRPGRAGVRSGQTRPNTRRATAKVAAALSPTAHRNVATSDLGEPTSDRTESTSVFTEPMRVWRDDAVPATDIVRPPL